ncbi:MAG: SCO family protein [Beijerinckiaceae bacterium]
MSASFNRRALLGGAGSILASPAFAQQTRPDPLARRFGGPFTLTDHDGRRVTDKTYAGRFMLVYFGFTRCVDACPVDLPHLAAALDKIAPLDSEIAPLFVTVDSDDTPAMMKSYCEALHPRLIGLTGNDAELAAVARAYRVHRYRVEMRSDSHGPRGIVLPPPHNRLAHGEKLHTPGQRYTIDHGTLTYLMDRNGAFLTLLPHASGSERIAEILRKYVRA